MVDVTNSLLPHSPILTPLWLDRFWQASCFPMRCPHTCRTAVRGRPTHSITLLRQASSNSITLLRQSPPTHSITLLRQASSNSGVSCRTHVFMLLSSACALSKCVPVPVSDTSHTVLHGGQKKFGGHNVKAGHTIGMGPPTPQGSVCGRSHA